MNRNIVSYSSNAVVCKKTSTTRLRGCWHLQIRHGLLTGSLMPVFSFNFIMPKNGSNGELMSK